MKNLLIIDLHMDNIKIILINSYNNIVTECTCTYNELGGTVKKFIDSINDLELRVLLTPLVLKDADELEILNSFRVGNIDFHCCISDKDRDELKSLCMKIGLNSFSLVSKFSLLNYIGDIEDCIILGEYVNRQRYAVHVGRNGIDDFRYFSKLDSRVINSMMGRYNCEVYCEFNDKCFPILTRNYTNFETLSNDCKLDMSLMLLSNLRTPDKVYKVINLDSTDYKDDYSAEESNEDVSSSVKEDEESSTIPSNDYHLEESPAIENDFKEEKRPTEKRPNRLIRIVGCLASICLGCSIILNANVPNFLNHYNELNDSVVMFSSSVESRVNLTSNLINSNNLGSEGKLVKKLKDLDLIKDVTNIAVKDCTVEITTKISSPDKLTEVLSKYQKVITDATANIIGENKETSSYVVQVEGLRFENNEQNK